MGRGTRQSSNAASAPAPRGARRADNGAIIQEIEALSARLLPSEQEALAAHLLAQARAGAARELWKKIEEMLPGEHLYRISLGAGGNIEFAEHVGRSFEQIPDEFWNQMNEVPGELGSLVLDHAGHKDDLHDGVEIIRGDDGEITAKTRTLYID